jgi:hypothetical protein
MAVLRKKHLKSGFVYVVDFYYHGKRKIISTRTQNRKLASKILNDIQARITMGTFNLADYEKKDISIKKLFEEYFPYAQTFKRASTIINEQNIAKTFTGFVGINR